MSVHVHVFCCSPSYPCDMVTVLHLVLYKTADLDFTTRERATHLLQILDKRLVLPGQSLYWCECYLKFDKDLIESQ